MEDIKRRLEYKNRTVQLQIVEKLYLTVKKKIPTNQQLSSSVPESPELQLLWQSTGSNEQCVAQRCCQVLIQLLKEGNAEFIYIMNGFLNQVPSAKNLSGIIEALTQLLVLQVILVHNKGDQYVCPYSIRQPPHPYITVVTNRPTESWPLIIEQIDRLFYNTELCIKTQMLTMLDPFLKYILLDPNSSDVFLRIRGVLRVRLVQLVDRLEDRQRRNKYLKYLLDLLCYMQIKTTEEVAEIGQFCVQLLDVYGNHANDLDTGSGDVDKETGNLDTVGLGERVVTYAIELCLLHQQYQVDSFCILQTLDTLKHTKPMTLCNEVNLCLLSELLLAASYSDSVTILSIVKSTLENGRDKISCLCSGFVVMATINILATPSSAVIGTSYKQLTSLAVDVLKLVEEYPTNVTTETSPKSHDYSLLTGSSYSIEACAKLAATFTSRGDSLILWLQVVDQHIKQLKTVPVCFVNLLVSVLLKYPDTGTSTTVLDKLSAIVKVDPTHGLQLLPVYLYMLRKTTCPTLRLHVLEAIPKLATHKYNVAPVLKAIQGLSTCAKLKSVSIKLLTDLWVLQDRCFPQLLKAVTDSGKSHITMATLTDDVTLAKARAIKEVCQQRPEQHGAEMLAPLSDILTHSTDEQSGVAAAMCLQALYYICEAEVIDILSAWSVLETKLKSDTRVVVIVKICELFSLVPSLQVRSEEFEVFHSESARLLWLYTQHTSDVVVSAAYTALSKYDHNMFRISHFRYQVVKEFVEQAEAILAEEETSEGSVDTVIPYVPGVCYIRLLDGLSTTSLKGYGDFLNAMVSQEVASLPRGIYYTSLQQHRPKSSEVKEIGEIPKFIQKQYENTKQPGLRPGLAAAMLLCYDPVLEVGRDGRPRKHYVMSYGKNFQQTFSALLQDVPVQPSDWYRMSLIGAAWELFVQKMFVAMLQARQTEVDLQLSRDFLDEKEANYKKVGAWVHVRDTIVDVIKKSSRGSPSEQFNCILALSGLVKATHKYYTSLDNEERTQSDDITEHNSHSHWLITVIDTCMSLVDFTHTPLSSLLGLCQQRSVDERLPASILAQAAAVLTLCQITSIVVGSYKDLVYKLMDMLVSWLPCQQDEEECPPVLFLFRGLGLGVMIEKLILANFADIEGTKGSLAVWRCIQKLEECTMTGGEYRIGAILGLSLCLGALCQDGQTESRVHLTAFHPKLVDLLSKTNCKELCFQPLCLCLASLTGCGFVANILPIETFDSTLSVLKQNMAENMNVGVARSVGFLYYAGETGGHPTIGQSKEELFTDWSAISVNQDRPEIEKIAVLTGLMSLIGADASILHTDKKTTTSVVYINKVVKQLKELTEQSEAVGVRTMTSWLLSNLYFSGTDTTASSSSSPASYSYLPESSVIRAMIDFLVLAGKQGPEFIPSNQVMMCLESLQREVTGTLPPLNWMSVLSPLMKLSFDDSVQYVTLQLAITVSTSSSSAAQFLSAWIVQPLFNSLSVRSQCLILTHCGCYVQCVTPSVLQSYLEKSCLPVFSRHDVQHKTVALKGLNSALQLKDPPQSTVALLYRTTEGAFTTLEKEQNTIVLSQLSECLSHLPNTVLDKLTAEDCTTTEGVHRGMFIRCYLVGNGCQPLPLLNSGIDAALRSTSNTDRLLWYILHSFHQLTQIDSSKSPILQRVQWLLEITGQCRNIATGTFKLSSEEESNMTLIIQFMVNIISAALCIWTGCNHSNMLLGVNSSIMCKQLADWSSSKSGDSKPISDWSGSQNEDRKLFSDWITDLKHLDCLSSAIQSMTSEPWSQILPKVIEWMICLLDQPETVCGVDVKFKLTKCLQVLRHSNEYRKIPVWTVAVNHTI